ncbi:MAG: hypothetical protein N2246_11830, partial [Candidatus Sumerlaeia bacterium]|nr:hypothetical protein [Candidatus Sumerlaeia bacterium]
MQKWLKTALLLMLLILFSLYLLPLKPLSSGNKNKTKAWIERKATSLFINLFQLSKNIHTSLKSFTEHF